MAETAKLASLHNSTMRKNKMKEFDQKRAATEKPSSLTLEQQQRAQGMLSKAQMLMDEQLDDVKKMN